MNSSKPRSTRALNGNHSPDPTPHVAVVMINRDPRKSSCSESSTQLKLKKCLFILLPYWHCFNTHEVGKTKVSVVQVMCTRSLRGQMPGDSDSMSGKPVKGPKNICSAWFWHLHHVLCLMNRDRQTWRVAGPEATTLGFLWLRLPFIVYVALISPACQTLLSLILVADGDGFETSQKTSSYLQQHGWTWRALR